MLTREQITNLCLFVEMALRRIPDLEREIERLVDEHDLMDHQLQEANEQAKRLTEERDAWKASQETAERQYKLLADQIPAEMINANPVIVEMVQGYKQQAEIGTRQIAELQQHLAQAQHKIQSLEKEKEEWKSGRPS